MTNRKSVGNKDINGAKAALTMHGKAFGWSTRWVKTGKAFNVVNANGEIIARWGL